MNSELHGLQALIAETCDLNCQVRVEEIGSRQIKATMISAEPSIASGAAAIDGIMALLMPVAKSDGFGAVDEVAIASKAQNIPTTVATMQSAANVSAVNPAQSKWREARVLGVLAMVPGV